MTVPVAVRSKPGPTKLALIGFVASVDVDVIFEVLLERESSGAQVALERPQVFRGVFGQRVVSQVVLVAHEPADVAGVTVQLGARLDVELQVALVTEDFAAQLARQLFLAVFPLFVSVQGRFLHRHPADVAANG